MIAWLRREWANTFGARTMSVEVNARRGVVMLDCSVRRSLMRPEHARTIARALIEAAHAADSDHFDDLDGRPFA